MSTDHGPLWPDLDDVAAARSAASYAAPDVFERASAEALQTETAYIAGVGQQIAKRCEAAAEPEAG